MVRRQPKHPSDAVHTYSYILIYHSHTTNHPHDEQICLNLLYSCLPLSTVFKTPRQTAWNKALRKQGVHPTTVQRSPNYGSVFTQLRHPVHLSTVVRSPNYGTDNLYSRYR